MSRLFGHIVTAAGRATIADLMGHLAQKQEKPGRTKSKKKAKKWREKWSSQNVPELNRNRAGRGAALCPSTEEA